MYIAIFFVCIFHSEPPDHSTGTFLARDKKSTLCFLFGCVCVGGGGGGGGGGLLVIFFFMI